MPVDIRSVHARQTDKSPFSSSKTNEKFDCLQIVARGIILEAHKRRIHVKIAKGKIHQADATQVQQHVITLFCLGSHLYKFTIMTAAASHVHKQPHLNHHACYAS